jgi:hypothetical protein
MKFLLSTALSILFTASIAIAQESPSRETTGSIGGKSLVIKYCAPSVRGRQIFGGGGLISVEQNYPIWRAGANAATSFHTDADLDINGLSVPKGDYTLYVLLSDANAWQLVISKQTGQWGLEYSKSNDLGRVKMTMSKPAAPVEELKYSITGKDSTHGKLELAWEQHIASVAVTVK